MNRKGYLTQSEDEIQGTFDMLGIGTEEQRLQFLRLGRPSPTLAPEKPVICVEIKEKILA